MLNTPIVITLCVSGRSADEHRRLTSDAVKPDNEEDEEAAVFRSPANLWPAKNPCIMANCSSYRDRRRGCRSWTANPPCGDLPWRAGTARRRSHEREKGSTT